MEPLQLQCAVDCGSAVVSMELQLCKHRCDWHVFSVGHHAERLKASISKSSKSVFSFIHSNRAESSMPYLHFYSDGQWSKYLHATVASSLNIKVSFKVHQHVRTYKAVSHRLWGRGKWKNASHQSLFDE